MLTRHRHVFRSLPEALHASARVQILLKQYGFLQLDAWQAQAALFGSWRSPGDNLKHKARTKGILFA